MINGIVSDANEITCGVPQGGLLAPLLYLCYNNDMELSVNSKLLLYADDSVLIVCDRDPDNIAKKLKSDLESCNQWFTENKLPMHIGKTECILFGSKRNLNKVKEFKIEYNGFTIMGQTSVKYLGVILEQTLSGELMAKGIIGKITKKLKFLYRYHNCFSQTLKTNLCSALLQCHFDYCSSSWYFNLSAKLKSRLQTTQNKIVRFVTGLTPRCHVGQRELSSIKYLNVSERISQLSLNHVFKIKTGCSPSYLKEMFVEVSNHHNFDTRNSSLNLFVPSVKGVDANSFFFQGIKLWSNLPSNLKSISNYMSFKRRVKSHLSDKAFAKEESSFVSK